MLMRALEDPDASAAEMESRAMRECREVTSLPSTFSWFAGRIQPAETGAAVT